MKEVQYKAFSLRTHKKNWQIKRPNVCQFELTFACELHCKHCYSDCYNKASYLKKELNTGEVKSILDKVYNAGVIWLCFTGGDPLKRQDFLEIYAYAKNKGFIVTVFTNGYSMTKKIADYFKESPPFVIELTLNAVNRKVFEHISGVKGSFEKTMDGLNMIKERKLPLNIKTMVTNDNLGHLDRIKKLFKRLDIKFRPNTVLYACLNGNLTPCNSRISPQEVLNLNGNKQRSDNGCPSLPNTKHRIQNSEDQSLQAEESKPNNKLFTCAAGGGDGINIDPYGQMSLCELIREPMVNLLTGSIEEGRNKILSLAGNKEFKTDSKCKYCQIKHLCLNCPGKALLETGEMERPVAWFCELAQLVAGRK